MTKTALRPIWDLWNLCDWLQESGRALNIHAAAVLFRTRDGQHSSHQNGDDVGVLYEILFATLPTFEDFWGAHVLVNVPYMKHLGLVAVGEKRQNLGMRTVQPITWCRCLDMVCCCSQPDGSHDPRSLGNFKNLNSFSFMTVVSQSGWLKCKEIQNRCTRNIMKPCACWCLMLLTSCWVPQNKKKNNSVGLLC